MHGFLFCNLHEKNAFGMNLNKYEKEYSRVKAFFNEFNI